MIIRVRSKEGTARVEIDETSTLLDLYKKISSQLGIPQFILTQSPTGGAPLGANNLTIKSMNFKNGDMLYLTNTSQDNNTNNTSNQQQNEAQPEEDEIDKQLAKKDGWVQRNRDPQLCHHGTHGKCSWCMPIPPWAIREYDPWKKEGVKYISFHGYLRKLQSGIQSDKRPIDPPSYRVKDCSKHPPWPEGICTECKPAPARIDAQTYRHVDYVQMESFELVDKFIQFWRETGLQRCGYLYGKYIPDENIPLGICASVEAVYEPPQKNSPEDFTLEKDPNEDKVDALAAQLGLTRIGFIWTDLAVDPKTRKPVKNRDVALYPAECLRMAKMQNKYPNVCRASTTNYCGSKFVGVCVTGNQFGEVELQPYQVSDQLMSLVRDGLISSKAKQVDMLRIRHSKKQFIPDVTYRGKDEYNNEVIKKAEPGVPIEFFILPIRHGAPKTPKPLLPSVQFPIENRMTAQQTAVAVKQIFDKFKIAGLKDFHLLVYMGLNTDAQTYATIASNLFKPESEAQLKQYMDNVLKTVQVPAPAPAKQASQPSAPPPRTQPTSTPTARPAQPSQTPSAPGVSATQKQAMINQIVSVGFTPQQAEEALWATSYASADAAIEFLLSQ